MCIQNTYVYIDKLPQDILPQGRQFGLRQCDLRLSNIIVTFSSMTEWSSSSKMTELLSCLNHPPALVWEAGRPVQPQAPPVQSEGLHRKELGRHPVQITEIHSLKQGTSFSHSFQTKVRNCKWLEFHPGGSDTFSKTGLSYLVCIELLKIRLRVMEI